MGRNLIIAIDGTSGSGKTTMAKLSAQRLNFFYLETGSFYRAFTWYCLKQKLIHPKIDVSLSQSCRVAKAIKKIIPKISIDFKWDGKMARVYLQGKEVSDNLHSPSVDKIVSYISEIKEVREKMVQIQRKLSCGKNVIGEGRDIGSVVFPDATLKIFVDCQLEERVKRRRREMAEKGISISTTAIRRNLIERDRIDSQRKVSPLIKLPEAIYIDTTNLTIEEEVNLLVELIRELSP